LVRTRKASKAPLTHTEAPSRSHSPRAHEKTSQTKAKQPAPKQAGSKSRAKHVIKCYKCSEDGHVSSNCPLRKFVNRIIRDGEDDEEYKSEDVKSQDVCE
jgi:hypothetical protein